MKLLVGLKRLLKNIILRIGLILYTYWLTYTSVGISVAKNKNKNIIQISRAHSGDVYEQQIIVFFFQENF